MKERYEDLYKRKQCRDCIHRRKITYLDTACHYMIDTGRKRPCPAKACTVKKTSGYIIGFSEDGTEVKQYVEGSAADWILYEPAAKSRQ